MLTAADPLPARPRRILVAGTSGSGKSTLARRIAASLDVPYTELDALFHGPGWSRLPRFEADVEAFSAEERWVCEWQYSSVRSLLAERADLLVWLDLPYPLAISRVVRRTVWRRWRREELWNGNVEAPLHTFFTDPDHIVRWATRTRNLLDKLVPAAEARCPQLTVVRLDSQRQVDLWLRNVLDPLA